MRSEPALAPHNRFWRLHIDAQASTCTHSASKAENSRQPFTRSQRLRFQRRRGEVIAPGLPLRFHPDPASQTVRLSTPILRFFNPGTITALGPFPRRLPKLTTVFRAAASLRAFAHRIRALSSDCNRETRLNDSPDLRSLPEVHRFLSQHPGSSFPVRYVSSGSLFP
ncbi:hypothetical protein, partial [Staphylococcus aureus]|uniref:hypothetical protein n=1 Tax=Staphylococcus aureus TaxID=1280 RepID=UPI001F2D9816